MKTSATQLQFHWVIRCFQVFPIPLSKWRLTSRIIACALFFLCEVAASALTLPPTEDTFGTKSISKSGSVTNASISPNSGSFALLPVSRTQTAFIQFDASSHAFDPELVSKVRLTLFLPTVTKVGDLSMHVVSEAWTEKFESPPRAQPSIAPSFMTIPASFIVRKQFLIVDVTEQVKNWLRSPTTDFGFAITSPDGVANVSLGAKEGPSFGYPALLEIEMAGSGLPGAIGPKGDAGAMGPPGPAGPVGAPGPAGPKGDPGLPGAMGSQGPIGLTGPKGDSGLTGAIGPQGSTGPAGLQGPIGSTGAMGLTGPAGSVGAPGPAGPKGDPGLPGATGSQGPIGLTGPKGDSGLTGAIGHKGLQAPQDFKAQLALPEQWDSRAPQVQ